ncbi:MAG: hypothetical protein ABI353_14755 [Isosphaeraceae bacterium]
MGRDNQTHVKQVKAKIRRQIARHVKTLYPDCVADFIGQQGHAAKTGRTFGFRVLDNGGKYRSNIVWVNPNYDGEINEAWVRYEVDSSNR